MTHEAIESLADLGAAAACVAFAIFMVSRYVRARREEALRRRLGR